VANPSLTVEIEGNTTGLDGSLKTATQTITVFGQKLPVTRIEKVVAAGQKLLQFTADLTKQGAAAQQSEANFQQALEARGIAYADVSAATDKAIKDAQALGFSDDAARDAIIALTTATGDLDTAMSHLPGAMDIARGSGKDLDTVTKAISSTLANDLDRGLGTIIEGLDHTGDAMSTLDAAYAVSAGQAATWASETAGQAAIAQIAIDEAAESVGAGLATAFSSVAEALGPLLLQLGELMNELLPVVVPLITNMANALGQVLGWVTSIVEKAVEFIQFLKDVISNLTSIGDKLPGILSDFKLINTEQEGLIENIRNGGLLREDNSPIINRSSAATGGASAATTGVGSSRAGGMVVNIYGDPSVIEARVASAIRNYNRRNGAGAILSPGRS